MRPQKRRAESRLGSALGTITLGRTAQAQARDGGLLGGHGADGAAPGAHVQRQHSAHHLARLHQQHAPPAQQPQRLLLQVALAARLRARLAFRVYIPYMREVTLTATIIYSSLQVRPL